MQVNPSESTQPDAGLTQAQAVRLAKELGPNLVRPSQLRAFRLLLRQLRSPLLLLLAVTAGVSYFLGEQSDAIIIGLILAVSVGLGFANEFQAARAAQSLRKRISHWVTVYRDGQPIQLAASELVPGDVIELHLGDIVPADLELLQTIDFDCDESALTGESVPAHKEPGSQAFMGTVVHSGSARARVTATGKQTQFGKISAGLEDQAPQTAFQKGLNRFSFMLVQIALALTALIFVINLILQRPLIDAILFSLAIAVGISPQLLPAVVSTSLTQGSRRLARQKVMVKRLVSIEDLGNIQVLFTDKTGTLTEGSISFDASHPSPGHSIDQLTQLAVACTDVTPLVNGQLAGNSLDVALMQHFGGAGYGSSTPAAAGSTPAPTRLDEIPFSHESRYMAVLQPGLVIAKGSPESIFELCENVPKEFSAQLDALLAKGLRVVAVASREVEASVRNLHQSHLTNLKLAGLLSFIDAPKPTAESALLKLRELGITTKIITGDSPVVAEYLCDQMQIPAGRTILGSELDAMDDQALTQALPQTRIFARVSPEQKARIVRVQREAGVDVAFLGDGVNDALAIHEADVGISVDSGTDVARDAADVLLLEKDLHVLADGVVEGRRIFANTTKYILMGTSSNFGNMFSAAAASAFLPFLPMLPSQILLNNLLYDLSQMAIPSDRVDPQALARPAAWDMKMIRRFMLLLGPISSLFDFLTFAVLLSLFQSDPEQFKTGWFIESLATQTFVVFVIRTRMRPAF
ncbi:MAG: magnesium-translocating P-type ATPase, partial [Micrococcales bacterium]